MEEKPLKFQQCESLTVIYMIFFLSAIVPTVLRIMSWILHLITVDIIIKWTGIHTAKMVSIPEVMMGQD